MGHGPDVFEALCTAAAQKLQGFSALEAVNPLWGMAKAGTRRRDVFEALCTATAQMLQDFNAREIAITLRAVAETSMQKPDISKIGRAHV